MKFKHTAFIRLNTPEQQGKVIEGLDKLGYTMSFVTMENPKAIKTQANGKYFGTDKTPTSSEVIDCGTNIPLFLAIAAIREDSDMGQWFYKYVDDEKVWYFCKHDQLYAGGYWKDKVTEWEKATPEELIEHFKDK